MVGLRSNAIRLFHFAGVDVSLHWSWFLVAVYEIGDRANAYSSLTWNVLEYLTLFLVVLLHEYGHALACRQVGGVANQIVLWPLGGVAYVNPPPRPGATLEHRCWTARKRISLSNFSNFARSGALERTGAGNAQRLCLNSVCQPN